MNMRKCRKCGEEKPETTEFFAKAKECKGGLSWACKRCKAKQEKAWKERNNTKKIKRLKGESIKATTRGPKNQYMVDLNQVVLYHGKKIIVTEILSQGHKGGRAPDGTSMPPRKAFICGCKIDPYTNKPLTRSSVHAGTDWQRI